MSVQLDTSHGAITIRLYCKETPRTCRNFIELAKHGYYDGIIFHRVVPDFVAQTGDPYGDGRGGESIYGQYFDDEISAKLSHDRKGVVSMANAGRNTNSSQFFLTFKDCPHLDGKHTVFGYVTEECLAVLDDIQVVKCKDKKPVTPVKIFTAQVLENPWEDEALPAGTAIPEKPLVTSEKKNLTPLQHAQSFIDDSTAVKLLWKHKDNLQEAANQLAEESTKQWRKEEEVNVRT